MNELREERRLSRRSFIKGSAIVAASGALCGCTAQTGNLAETGEEEVAASPMPAD